METGPVLMPLTKDFVSVNPKNWDSRLRGLPCLKGRLSFSLSVRGLLISEKQKTVPPLAFLVLKVHETPTVSLMQGGTAGSAG